MPNYVCQRCFHSLGIMAKTYSGGATHLRDVAPVAVATRGVGVTLTMSMSVGRTMPPGTAAVAVKVLGASLNSWGGCRQLPCGTVLHSSRPAKSTAAPKLLLLTMTCMGGRCGTSKERNILKALL